MEGPLKSNLANVVRSLCESRGFDYEDLVGEGAFKGVFRIKRAQGEVCALKIIKGPIADNRTEREVEALQKCTHPNIGKLLAVGTHDFEGTSYTFMLEEFLSGGTLTERLDKHGLLDSEGLFNLGLSLIDAVGYLAGLGLVHRDIKPDNVMFRADCRTPVLVDFNLVVCQNCTCG
jgi:serine/threonine protein kinase